MPINCILQRKETKLCFSLQINFKYGPLYLCSIVYLYLRSGKCVSYVSYWKTQQILTSYLVQRLGLSGKSYKPQWVQQLGRPTFASTPPIPPPIPPACLLREKPQLCGELGSAAHCEAASPHPVKYWTREKHIFKF